jgi:hypothetical protein
MSREVHVRFREGAGVRFPRATRLVCALERQEEAERFYTMRGQRLGKFGRERAAEKTRVMPFSRQPPAPKTSFAFLGFVSIPALLPCGAPCPDGRDCTPAH